jgi:hypothetical protein
MKKKPRTKLTIDNVAREVPLIKELYEEFIKKGFTSEQAFILTNTLVKLVMK